jgi:3',5'-cyclic AMP phosphodiesterase CpdA
VTTLLHISDTHFGTEQPPVVEALAVLASGLSPDLLVISGDITQRARAAQFAAARRFIDRLALPFVSIPGNHDLTVLNPLTRLLAPYTGYRRTFGDALEPVHESAGLLVQCVKTTRWWRHIEGEVNAAQVQRVAARLRSARAEQLRVVVVHQPPHVEGQAEARHLLRGRDAALSAWAEAGADVVLGGHIHLPYVAELTPAGASGARIVVAQAGTALSSRLRRDAPNSVNVIRHDASAAARCTIERWDFSGECGEFQRIDTRAFELQRS